MFGENDLTQDGYGDGGECSHPVEGGSQGWLFFCEADSSDTEGMLVEGEVHDDGELSSPERVTTVTEVMVTPERHHDYDAKFAESDYQGPPPLLYTDHPRTSSKGSVSDEMVCGANGLIDPARLLYNQVRAAKRSASEGRIFRNNDWTEKYIIDKNKSCVSEEWNIREKDLLEAEETVV